VIDFSTVSASIQVPLYQTLFQETTLPDGSLWTQFFRTDAGYLVRFPDLADFQVSADGLYVSCSPAPDVTEATIQHLYLNQVHPLALSKMGKMVFHASSVEVGDSAIAFVGESGRGKSTLAASFAINGFRFLTDDGLLVEAGGNDAYLAFPSHPSIRLWQDSQEVLISTETVTAQALDFTTKGRFLAGKHIAFCDQPRPLRRVYFLGDGSAPVLLFQRMTGTEAIVEWTKHSFLLDVEEKTLLAEQFDRVSKLACQPIYYRLDYPRCFEQLTHIRQAIVEHSQAEGLQ
jgi:hypothetical protein